MVFSCDCKSSLVKYASINFELLISSCIVGFVEMSIPRELSFSLNSGYVVNWDRGVHARVSWVWSFTWVVSSGTSETSISITSEFWTKLSASSLVADEHPKSCDVSIKSVSVGITIFLVLKYFPDMVLYLLYLMCLIMREGI